MDVGIPAEDPLPEQTVRRPPTDNGRAGIATLQSPFGLIEPQATLSLLLVRTVTLKTGVRKYRPHVAVECHLPRAGNRHAVQGNGNDET